MTRAAQEFVTPLSVGALTSDRVFTDLFDLNDEREIGHIRLSREADLIVVAPATADLLAKMAGGHADDLASCVLMATDKPVLVAPAMNPRMWLHPATRRNVALLQADGIHFIGPNIGEMAERGEAGPGPHVGGAGTGGGNSAGLLACPPSQKGSSPPPAAATGTVVDVYHKVRIVPFGEYVPLRGLVEPFAGDALPRARSAAAVPVPQCSTHRSAASASASRGRSSSTTARAKRFATVGRSSSTRPTVRRTG